MTTSPLACVILAGGRGTRMKSATPKLLHRACGRPVLAWVLAAVAELAPARTVVVVGAESEDVRAILPEAVEAVTQAQPLGTGDAARTARGALEGFAGDVVVMNGDHPLTDPASLAGPRPARVGASSPASPMSPCRPDGTRTNGPPRVGVASSRECRPGRSLAVPFRPHLPEPTHPCRRHRRVRA